MLMSIALAGAITYFFGYWGRLWVGVGAISCLLEWILWHRPMFAVGRHVIQERVAAATKAGNPTVEREVLRLWKQQTFFGSFTGLYLAPLPLMRAILALALRISGDRFEEALRLRAGHYVDRLLQDKGSIWLIEQRLESVGAASSAPDTEVAAAPFASGRWMVVQMNAPSTPEGFVHVLTTLGPDRRPLLAMSASNSGIECIFYPSRFSGQQYEASVALSGLGLPAATYRAICRRRGSDCVSSHEMDKLWQEVSATSSPVFTVRVTCGAETTEFQVVTDGCAEAAKEWRRRIDADLPELAGRLPH
jgi:hypothetical protein